VTSAKPRLAELPAWPRLMDVETAAAYLSVSPPTAERWLEDLQINRIERGRRVLYDRHAIDRALDGAVQVDAESAPQTPTGPRLGWAGF
jgi:excisionase family DNA binding protein